MTSLKTCNLPVGSLQFHVTTLKTCNLSVGSLHCHVTTGTFGASSCSRKVPVEEDGEWPLDTNGIPLVKGDSCDGDTPQDTRHCLMVMMSAGQVAQWQVTRSHNSHYDFRTQWRFVKFLKTCVGSRPHTEWLQSNDSWFVVLECLNKYDTNTVGSRFSTGLRSRIFGCKSSRRKTSTI